MQITFLSILFSVITYGQNVGIGTSTPDVAAQLEVSSNTKGVLIPRMTSTQRASILLTAKGLLVYDSTSNSFWYHNGAAWTEIGGLTGLPGGGLPAGSASQTMRFNGSAWVANNILQNDGNTIIVANQLKINGGAPGAGKVLTSDAIGISSWSAPSYDSSRNTAFSTENTSSQALSASFLPTFTNENFDDGNTVTGGIFTATASGVYSFISSARFDLYNCFTRTSIMMVIESGTSIQYGKTESTQFAAGYTGSSDLQVSALVKLTAGSQVRVRVLLNGNTINLFVGNINFKGFRIY